MPRIDNYLVFKSICDSRNSAQRAIKDGEIFCNGLLVTKNSQIVNESDFIELKNNNSWVSRSAAKLQLAFDTWPDNLTNKLICYDIGASTGGFTQVLLENGAEEVLSIDVGSGQMNPRIKNDKRVTLWESCNARHLNKTKIIDYWGNKTVDLLVADVSFISLKLLIPVFDEISHDDTIWVLLLKPQFELEKTDLHRGVVKSRAKQAKAIREVVGCASDHNRQIMGFEISPIKGTYGNQEFILLFNAKNKKTKIELEAELSKYF